MKNIVNFRMIFLLIMFVMSVNIESCDHQSNKLSNKLNIYNWSGIIAKNTIPDFERENKVKVTLDYYSTNDELLAKLQAGGTGYDIIFPSDFMIGIMIKQGLLEKLDLSNIPNFKNISSKYLHLPHDPTDEYSVPYQISSAGLGIDTSKIKNYKASWDILFDERFKGQITMLDDMRYGMIPALKKLGYSVNTTNVKELNAAKKLMMDQKRLVRAYSSDTYIDLLKSGEVSLVYGYGTDIYQVAKENPNIIYIIPEEGTGLSIESMCIPKGAPHKFTAEYFINYILKPEVHANITNFTMFANPNEAATPFIDKKILSDKNIFFGDNILKRSEYVKDVGSSTQLYYRIWTEIKTK